MKKEYFAIGILGLFVFGYVLDYIAGPISISINSPFSFFSAEYLSKFPFTAVSIGIKTLGILSLLILMSSFIRQKYFIKSAFIFCFAGLLELYAIQQMLGGVQSVPIHWILTMTATGIVLLIPTIVFFILGVGSFIVGQLPKKPITVSD